MTDQWPDSCTYDGRKWVIEAWDGDTEIIPTNDDLGIRTEGPSTANYSGRIDHYLVHARRLYLLKMEVCLPPHDRDQLPTGATREVILRYEPWEVTDAQGKRNETREQRTDYFVFHDLLVPFTGSLILSFPFFDFWEVPWPIDEVDGEVADECTLEFDRGLLVAARHSQNLAKSTDAKADRPPTRSAESNRSHLNGQMKLTSTAHARLARALHRDAADAKLTLPQERELQAQAKRHEALAKHARDQESGKMSTRRIAAGRKSSRPPMSGPRSTASKETRIDPREVLLNKAATRLAQLLKAMAPEDQAAAREEAIAILRENDLLFVEPREGCNPMSFALALIEENEFLFEVVGDLRIMFNPKVKTVEELILNLVPSISD